MVPRSARTPLKENTPAGEFKNLNPHVTKKIAIGAMGLVFPLKERYDWYNFTIEGLEEASRKLSLPEDHENDEVFDDRVEVIDKDKYEDPPRLKAPVIGAELSDTDPKPWGHYGVYIDT